MSPELPPPESVEQQNTEYFCRIKLEIPNPDGSKHELEGTGTYDEAVTVPIIRDPQTGEIKILLATRVSPISGMLIPSALAATVEAEDPTDTPSAAQISKDAARAFDKLDIPGAEHATPQLVGRFSPWKYLSNMSHCHAVFLDADLSQIENNIKIKDPSGATKGFLLLTPDEFYAQTQSEDFSSIRTLLSVQYALAAYKAREGIQSPGIRANTPGKDDTILELLDKPLPPISEKIVPLPVGPKDYFKRDQGHTGDTIILSGSQVQALGVRSVPGEEDRILFLIEPFLVQPQRVLDEQGKWVVKRGKRTLTFPSGSREKDKDGKYGTEDGYEPITVTAKHETLQETGYELTNIEPLTQPRYPSLYSTVSSTVCVGELGAQGNKDGGDEAPVEQGVGVEIPVSQIGWYIRHGYISDASVIAALLDWGRAHDVNFLQQPQFIAVSGPRAVKENTSQAEKIKASVVYQLNAGKGIIVGPAEGVDMITIQTVRNWCREHNEEISDRLQIALPCSYDTYVHKYLQHKIENSIQSKEDMHAQEILKEMYQINPDIFDQIPDDPSFLDATDQTRTLRKQIYDEVNARMLHVAGGALVFPSDAALRPEGYKTGTQDFLSRAQERLRHHTGFIIYFQ